MTKRTFLPLVVGCLWMLINLVPPLLIDESFGMVWTGFNAPLSYWLKDTWLSDYLYPYLWIAVTTAANAILLALLVGLGLSLLGGKGEKR